MRDNFEYVGSHISIDTMSYQDTVYDVLSTQQYLIKCIPLIIHIFQLTNPTKNQIPWVLWVLFQTIHMKF